jgi:hypothetical protein
MPLDSSPSTHTYITNSAGSNSCMLLYVTYFYQFYLLFEQLMQSHLKKDCCEYILDPNSIPSTYLMNADCN